MNRFPTLNQRKEYYQKEGEKDYQQNLYGNPSDWIHHRIRNLSIRLIKNILKEIKNARVLDIGCAEGLYLREISAFMGRGVGIDIAENKITRAKKKSRKHKNLEFVSGDFLSYKFGKKKFNLIISVETLEHVPYIEKVLKKINWALKERGFFIVSVPTDKEMLFYKYKGDWKKASGHLYNWSKFEFARLLKKNGFTIIKSRGVNNIATQIFSVLVRNILKLFKKNKKNLTGSKAGSKSKIRNQSSSAKFSLTKGARVFYKMDEFFTSLPILNNFNNYNMFVCKKL